MIKVRGEKIVLEGTDTLLQKELAYLLSMMHSRIVSKGNNEHYADGVIRQAVSEAELYAPGYLRSEAKMCAEIYKGDALHV